MSGARGGNLGVSVRFQSAAEIAELNRRIKEEAPKLRAAAEAKAAKAAELAERNKVPKVAVTLPADAKDVKQTKDEIKFTVGKRKPKRRRILSETVSRRGLERRRRFTRTQGRHILILKRKRAECDHHLLRYGFHADRGQSVGDAGGTGSGEVESEVRSRKSEVGSQKEKGKVTSDE
jgi:hypothetical protein